MTKRVSILLISLFCSWQLFGQKKIEYEKRIKKEEMPRASISALSQVIPTAQKLKFYKETNGGSISYEGKFVLNKNHYSVEFNDTGELEDVEQLICFTSLPKNIQYTIADYLMRFQNFKIKKTQKQFSSYTLPDKEVIEKALKNIATGKVNYELIVEVKENREWRHSEMLFDRKGNFISEKEIIGRQADHIIY